jgi:hypothetical protein
MVKYELIDNGHRIHHFSDEDFKLLQNETGIIYNDAIDIMPCRYTYSESYEKIEIINDNENID